ncbi:MAG: thiolase family protein [Chloroflexota bacterium]
MTLEDVVVVGAVRTAIGKHGGGLRSVRPDDLAAHVVGDVVRESHIDPHLVDEVFVGAANQAGEDNRNVARMAILLAGLPVEVAGATVNRLCGSGLQAVVSAAREIQVGAAQVVIAAGVESMTRAPFVMPKTQVAFERGNQTIYDTTLGWRMVNPRLDALYPAVSLGQTAENVAQQYNVTRAEQDEWALCSHQKALDAQRVHHFDREIRPLPVAGAKGQISEISCDEGPRPDTTMNALGRLSPVFVKGGTVTAGNSSQISDGAAALLLMSRRAAQRHNLRPLARFIDAATAGVDPSMMGMGPVPATHKLLRRVGITVRDLDVVEVNEAFASQVVACVRELELDPRNINRYGGAIALGHPLGASGARLVTTLVNQLNERPGRYGLATMCIGVGQGISALFERTEP